MAWYNASWSNRLKVTIDNTKVPGDLTDFVVYLDLSDIGTSHGFWSTVKSDGADIRVTKSDETTEVAVEVVTIDTVAETGEVHFIADGTLSSSSDTDFYVYYGNSGASMPAVTDTYGRNAVWADYDFVCHMEATPVDSTGNHTGLSYQNSPTEVTGKLAGGSAHDMNGSTQYLSVPDSDSLSVGLYSGTSESTISAWIEPDTQGTTDANDMPLFSKYTEYLLGHEGSNGFYYRTTGGNNGGTTTLATVDTWQLIHALWDVGTDIEIYKDGISIDTTAVTDTSPNTTNPLRIGSHEEGATDEYFDGAIDEFRIHLTLLSSDWITTEYNNQNSPSTFYTIGSEESAPTGGTPTIIITQT